MFTANGKSRFPCGKMLLALLATFAILFPVFGLDIFEYGNMLVGSGHAAVGKPPDGQHV
jgi:hypothetical protein